MTLRPLGRVAIGLGLALAAVLAVPGQASAHPLGSTTVNHYDELVLRPDGVTDLAVLDTAEIPTFQRRFQVDRDRDGVVSPGERTSHAARSCSSMAEAVELRVSGRLVPLQVLSSRYDERPGQAGLATGRLECMLLGRADLSVAREVAFRNDWDDAVVGWHEVVARAEGGVRLENSPFPSTSISQQLRAYPDDLLGSPLDVRSGTLNVSPGSSSTYALSQALPGAGPVARALDGASRRVNEVVGRDRLTLGVGLLGVVLAMALGAGHALLPGHGKTVMAAYLVGRRGTLRDVVVVGATVTVTHTAGVLVLGGLLTAGVGIAPATVERHLGVVAGVVIAAVGLGLLLSTLRRRRATALEARAVAPHVIDAPLRERVLVGVGAETKEHGHHHHDDHDQHHSHSHDGTHGGSGGHGHHHGFRRSGVVGLGVAGGLVPSPSALLVLLAAVALGRTAFGVSLVLAYGLGMALVLCLAGVLLVRLGGRLSALSVTSRTARVRRVLSLLPLGTALLLVVLGAGLALRAGVA